MKGAVVIVRPLVGKGYADSRRPGRYLGGSGPVWFRCPKEPGVHETILVKGRRRRGNRVYLRVKGGMARSSPSSGSGRGRAIDRPDHRAGRAILAIGRHG